MRKFQVVPSGDEIQAQYHRVCLPAFNCYIPRSEHDNNDPRIRMSIHFCLYSGRLDQLLYHNGGLDMRGPGALT